MNIKGLIAVAALASAASAHAQQSFEPAVPRGLQEQRVQPSGELTQPAETPLPPRLVQNQARAQRDADARHCLQRSANKDIHRCAHPYLSREARQRVRSATAKSKSTTRAASRPAQRAADVARPPEPVATGAPRASDAAKAADLVKPMDVTRPAGTPRPVEAAKSAPATSTAGAATSGATAPNRTPGPKLPPMGSAADPTAAPPAAKAAK